MAVPSELTENDMVGLRVRDRLTAKELRIVALIVQGYKNKEIATQLGTTEQVIKNYLRNVTTRSACRTVWNWRCSPFITEY